MSFGVRIVVIIMYTRECGTRHDARERRASSRRRGVAACRESRGCTHAGAAALAFTGLDSYASQRCIFGINRVFLFVKKKRLCFRFPISDNFIIQQSIKHWRVKVFYSKSNNTQFWIFVIMCWLKLY